jgi:hypothetical protein
MRGGDVKGIRVDKWPHEVVFVVLALAAAVVLSEAVVPVEAGASSQPSPQQIRTCDNAALGHKVLIKSDMSACAQFPYITFNCPRPPGGRVIRVKSFNIALRLGHKPVRFGDNYTTTQLQGACKVTKTSPALAAPSAPKAPTSPSSSKAPTTLSIPASFAGTAHPSVTPGKSGKVSIVFIGAPYSPGNIASDGTIVPIAIWNGTTKGVNDLSVSGSASSAGRVIGSGQSQNIEPPNLAPGQVAFGIVFFETPVPAGSTFDLSVSTAGSFSNTLVVQTTQANYVAGETGGFNTVVGSVTNTSKVPVTSPISADVFCFTNGVLTAVDTGYTSGESNLGPGAIGSYSTNVEDTCPTFLVGASGFAD